MPSTNENGFSGLAWGVSLALHAGLVWLAVLFATQVKPVFNEDVFKWDVALIEAEKMDSAIESMSDPASSAVQHVVPPVQPPARLAAPRTVEPAEPVMRRVSPPHDVHMSHPDVQASKPVEQRERPLPSATTEPVASAVPPVGEKTVEPIQPQPVEASKAPRESAAASEEPELIKAAEPMVAQRQPSASSSQEGSESLPMEVPAKPSAPEPIASSPTAEPAPAISSASSPGPQEAPVQVAKAAPPTPEVKTDHRWIAESLWKRVAELKRYPSSARLNGQEGRVVLKAVIRSDGHLAEVSVQKSSGHTVLDAAAIEAVKLACPLYLKHPINKPEIVVSLPIVYSLAN